MLSGEALQPKISTTILRWTALTCGMLLAAAHVQGADTSVDNSVYASLLAQYVTASQVDYAGFKREEAGLDRYLRVLEAVDPATLSRDDQFAFYVNAYNAWTIKLVLSGYPGIGSIKELGSLFSSPWKKEIARINGETLTLDEIEHEILRPRFKDPRVHFAINCASKSCPPLRAEPYRGEVLDRQLTEATTSFLNQPDSHRFEGDTFFVSRIFDWFAEDFNHDPVGFYRQYAQADLRKRLEASGDALTVQYLDYDWSLNGK